MRISRLISGALVLLGFGGVVGLGSGCSASRAQRSRPSAGADSVVTRDSEVIMVMYGVRPTPYDRDRVIEMPVPRNVPVPDKPVREGASPVSGRITDEYDEPIHGAVVMVVPEELEVGVVTDEEGRYEIDAVVGDWLRIDFLGYLSQTRVVGRQKTMDVRMEPDTMPLEEQVVIAMYGVPNARYDLYKPVPRTKPRRR
ncbi:MAG: carboxypeptidase-like regulatory domain-containing protein [Alistipes sp.]|jgi:hypothetical protein|nr:carboxypeptidase-like regulatory domain-containing protein [Alistipes sp.]